MVDGRADVLDAGVWVFQVVRLAAAVALEGGVEGERHEALLGQLARVQAGGCSFTPPPGWTTTIAACRRLGSKSSGG
ncbi:hypothetical protein RKD49_000065 [Streptomyces glaucescens]